MVRDLSKYARFDPAFAIDGLFTPTARKGHALYDVGREYDGGEISFEGVQLTAAHQSVLLAVCARTGRNGLQVRGTKKDPLGSQFGLGFDGDQEAAAKNITALRSKGEAEDEETAIVECSAYAILADAGMDHGGNNYATLSKLLTQLATVVMYRRVGKRGGSSNLLSFDHQGDRMSIALNWRLAASILGDQQNVRVSLYERQKLKGSVSRLLHAWLSCYVRQGYSLMDGQGAKLDTLARHIWGKRPASAGVDRNRRTELRKAIQEIGQLSGWIASVDQKGIARFSRPKELDSDLPGDDAEKAERTDRFLNAFYDGKIDVVDGDVVRKDRSGKT